MVETCIRCNVEGNEVRLFDAIYEGRMCNICERCSIIENIPIIKKPEISQLRESEKGEKVYERMRRLSGIKEQEQEKTFFKEDKLKTLDNNPLLELPQKDKLNLVEHFHWNVMNNRRRKGLTQETLAEAIGESETAIQMIEKAQLPENAETLIKKLEQFFQVKLRKIDNVDELMKIKRKEARPVLLDRGGNELESIPEFEIKKNVEIGFDEELVEETEKEIEPAEIIEFGKKDIDELPEPELEEFEIEVESGGKQEAEQEVQRPVLKGDLDVKKISGADIRISDLRELHRKKIEVTRQEQIEEQKKIEEKQRLIEARKEELKLIKEKESFELDKALGGIELLNGEGIKKLEDSDSVEEFDEELI